MPEVDAARAEIEATVLAMCRRGDHAAAAAHVVRTYGRELYSFFAAINRSEADASDAFSDLAEAVMRGLPTFAGRSTLRTWLYGIARNVSHKRVRNEVRRRKRIVAAGESTLEGIVEEVRSETAAFLRTENKTRLRALRDALGDDDRILLVLRVDRGLGWDDLARVLHDGEGDARLDDAALAREAARLRKRFQLVRDRLREMAKKQGLLRD